MKKILLPFLAVLMLCSFARSASIPDSLERKYWMNLLRNVKLTHDLKPVRYQKDIKIELQGEISKEDRMIVDSIVRQLKPLIQTVSISRVDTGGNLVIILTRYHSYTFRTHIVGDEIGYKIEDLQLFSPRMQAHRYDAFLNKIIKMILIHSPKQFPGTVDVCFTNSNLSSKNIYYTSEAQLLNDFLKENNNKQIEWILDMIRKGIWKKGQLLRTTYMQSNSGLTAPDKFIIETIYAKDADSRIKNGIIKYTGSHNYYSLKYHKAFQAFNKIYPLLLKLLLSIIFLGIVCKRNRYRGMLSYLLIGSALFFLYSISQDLNGSSEPFIQNAFSASFIIMWLIALAHIALFYCINRLLRKSQITQWLKDSVSSAIVFIMVISFAYFSFDFHMSEPRVAFTILASAIFTVAYYLLSRMVFKQREVIRQKDEELSRLQMVKAQTELQALQSKLNPHFLYNSLNSLSHLVRVDADRAEKMTLLLSDLFRYTLSRDRRDFVELHEELNMVEKYLEVERVRFGDRLSSTIEMDEQASTCSIPRLIVQPLVENAIKHGISKISGEGFIHIVAKVDEGRLTITVEDNGPVFPDAPIAGFGLQNIIERLQLLYDSDAELSWTNLPTKKVTITIPTEK
ncbi:histidine kinase [uncultured Acetobacteroides sp.]|uniref:sensor histidine kinase n=1 Tax=uncultured Acetobacteroides sp. TaxID=1760811 RepID=UPI0029F4AEBA|nr:histidine kinase [uncultured Acetobacteroides sp.]